MLVYNINFGLKNSDSGEEQWVLTESQCDQMSTAIWQTIRNSQIILTQLVLPRGRHTLNTLTKFKQLHSWFVIWIVIACRGLQSSPWFILVERVERIRKMTACRLSILLTYFLLSFTSFTFSCLFALELPEMRQLKQVMLQISPSLSRQSQR